MEQSVLVEIVPVTWRGVVFVSSVLVTVLSAYGALIKYNYDQTKQHRYTLLGNGHDGVVDSFNDAIEQQAVEQEQLHRIVRSQAAIIQELVYTMNEVSDSLEHAEDVDEIDMRRLKHLERALRAHDIDEDVSYKAEEDDGVDQYLLDEELEDLER